MQSGKKYDRLVGIVLLYIMEATASKKKVDTAELAWAQVVLLSIGEKEEHHLEAKSSDLNAIAIGNGYLST